MSKDDRKQGGPSVMKFAEISHGGPKPCTGRNSTRNRESVQRQPLSGQKKKLLAILRREAGGTGAVVKPIRFYAAELRITRVRAKELLLSLQSAGFIKLKDEWEEGIRRMKVCIKEDKHESKD